MIVYYPGNNKEKQQVVQAILQASNHPFKMLSDADVNNSITSLMQPQHTTVKKELRAPCNLDILIFHEVEDEAITHLSQTLRAQNAHVERKAVLTMHNKDWTLLALLQEIAQEHRYYVAYDQLKQNLTQANTMEESSYQSDSWKAYQTSFINAYITFQNPDKQSEDMELANQAYALALQGLQLK